MPIVRRLKRQLSSTSSSNSDSPLASPTEGQPASRKSSIEFVFPRPRFNVGSKREKKDKSPEKDGLKSKKSLKSPIRPSRSSVQNKRTLAE